MSMRVLHVVPSFDMGGMERIICTLVNKTSNLYAHCILSLDIKNDAYVWINNCDVEFKILCKNTKRLDFFRNLYMNMKNINPDLLMTYNWGATDAIWIGRILRIDNIIHSIHGYNIDEYKKFNWKRYIIRLILYKLSKNVIVPSIKLRSYILEKFYLDDKKVVFIPNGIDTESYRSDEADRKVKRKELGLTDNDFVVGFVGRLDPIKNFNLMFDIFSFCCQKDKNFKLLVVGEGEERESIENNCKKRNIACNVMMLGEKKDVIPYIRTFDALLMTSYSEQMPMSIIESMAIGVPVVSSDVGEIANMVDHGKNGFLFDLNDNIEHVSQFLFELNQTPIRQMMGKHARNKVVAEFQQEKMLQQYIDLIENTLPR